MSIPRMAKAMTHIDDELVSGAAINTKTKKKSLWLKWGAMAACLCLVVFGVMTWNDTQVNLDNAGNTLMGADEIYPTVMVQGQLYEWRKGAAICKELPNNCVYYDEVTHVEGQTPASDSEFVSVFSVSGQIYTVPENGDCVYLCLTTDWLNETIVVFDLVE